jgi:valyl-tRNA synthetase
VLDRLLRLIHPVIPFVTEELWTALTGAPSIMVATWPGQVADGTEALPPVGVDAAAEAEIDLLMRVVTEVRRFRSDQGLRPGQPVPARISGLTGSPLAAHEGRIRSLLRLAEPGDSFAATGSVQSAGVTVELDTAATIDVAAERKRLTKDLATARADIAAAEKKLGNQSFVDRAPADVVAKNRDRLAAAEAEAARLEDRLAALPA